MPPLSPLFQTLIHLLLFIYVLNEARLLSAATPLFSEHLMAVWELKQIWDSFFVFFFCTFAL